MKYIVAKCNTKLGWNENKLDGFKFMNLDFRKKSFKKDYCWYSDGYDIIINERKTGENWYLRKAKKKAIKCNLRTFENSKSMVNSLKMFKLLGYGFNAWV